MEIPQFPELTAFFAGEYAGRNSGNLFLFKPCLDALI
jgi:hypothetical protein